MDWKSRSAYVFIKTTEGKAHDIWQRFQKWENVIGAWIVTGECDVIVWFDAKDWDEVHRCVADIKNWDGVEYTSSHLVYSGFKNGGWWWEKLAGTWVLLREGKLDEAPERIKKWPWAISGASIPGDWDCIAWIQGENWNEVWDHLIEFTNEGWETRTNVPVKSWWNQEWKNKWW